MPLCRIEIATLEPTHPIPTIPLFILSIFPSLWAHAIELVRGFPRRRRCAGADFPRPTYAASVRRKAGAVATLTRPVTPQLSRRTQCAVAAGLWLEPAEPATNSFPGADALQTKLPDEVLSAAVLTCFAARPRSPSPPNLQSFSRRGRKHVRGAAAIGTCDYGNTVTRQLDTRVNRRSRDRPSVQSRAKGSRDRLCARACPRRCLRAPMFGRC